MADFLIDFEWFWCPDGYQIVNARESARARGGRPTSYPHGDWIVPKSEDKIPCRPLDRFDTLCDVFAKVKTPDELLEFVTHFGTLMRTSRYWGDLVSDCLSTAQYFRGLLLSKQKGPRKLLSFFKSHMQHSYHATSHIGSVSLVENSESGVRLSFTADTLLDALWLQLGQKLSGHRIIRECRHCGSLFEAGADTGLRADATFCCREHSVRFHSLKRSRGG